MCQLNYSSIGTKRYKYSSPLPSRNTGWIMPEPLPSCGETKTSSENEFRICSITIASSVGPCDGVINRPLPPIIPDGSLELAVDNALNRPPLPESDASIVLV